MAQLWSLCSVTTVRKQAAPRHLCLAYLSEPSDRKNSEAEHPQINTADNSSHSRQARTHTHSSENSEGLAQRPASSRTAEALETIKVQTPG